MPLSTVTQPAPAVVEQPRWPVPEERRTVSVLFADIVGSTRLVDRLDPEDVRALQREYFDTIATVLRRWNGVVEKYIGDAVMALFGGVDSDGFDAYRAVRAGLEIQRTLDRRPLAGGIAVRIRVGVATGEAVVDLAAARDGGHAAVSGAVVTLAARLQEYAPKGEVVACTATHRATADLIGYRNLPPVTVAGKELPIDLWQAEGDAPARPLRADLPLIGRRRELAALHDQLRRAIRDRAPGWISVVGPDGIGRTRLLAELAGTVRQVDGAPVRWCRAQCPPRPDAPLAPLAALLRDLAGIQVGDAPEAVRQRLAAVCGPLVPAGQLPATVAALDALLAASGAVPSEAGASGRGSGSAAGAPTGSGAQRWLEVLLSLATRQPVVVAVDDVDRAGPEVGRFLHQLHATATARKLPLVVLVTHRPEWADLVPLGAGDRHHRLTVPPLGALDTGRLLRHLLGGDVAAVTRLLPLVGGNPGWARAYAGQVTEGGLGPGEPPVPGAVRRTVDARLDRLDGTGRAVLMAGAALDAGFTADDVAGLLGLDPEPLRPVLRGLVVRGLLVWRSSRHGYAVADRVLARVAYERLPRALRAEFRRRAGQPGELTRPVRLAGLPAQPAGARRVAGPVPGAGAGPAARPARGRPASLAVASPLYAATA
ncbi:adenylate/guanylate cyclase domain-containing protein [Micromonospora cathayae]|uniref:Adenylate/guanylate cyclase domain-containing protein n=1 Tax=Micromonospora cathayae TaxID=3028804 RepID=A0ABY7ZKK0_9ACTN|nr:adenylate/guanylate cyclase domain-containing protein [Micromonospora sp. HUAS 3]WDZ82976.1 adenylate/guanylate cyclase domain-containing protein [Micromonospora sp. HUAS 3]